MQMRKMVTYPATTTNLDESLLEIIHAKSVNYGKISRNVVMLY